MNIKFYLFIIPFTLIWAVEMISNEIAIKCNFLGKKIETIWVK